MPLPRESTRRKILDNAHRLFSTYGFRKTSVSDLTRAAGIGKGTLYLFFKNKEAVLHHLMRREQQKLLEAVQAAALEPQAALAAGRGAAEPEPALGTAGDKLRAVALARIVHVTRQARLAPHALDFFVSGDPVFQMVISLFEERHLGLITEIIEEGNRAGECAEAEPRRAARAFFSAFSSLLPPYLENTPEEELIGLGRDLARLLVEGLKAR